MPCILRHKRDYSLKSWELPESSPASALFFFFTLKQELPLLSEQTLPTQALAPASSCSDLHPSLLVELLTKLGDLQNTTLHMAVLIQILLNVSYFLELKP